MSGQDFGARAAFWMAVVFTGLVLVAWNANLSSERETVASLRQDLRDAQVELARLEGVASKGPELQREISNLEAQLAQLSAIMPPSSSVAERFLVRNFTGRGLKARVLKTETPRPTPYPGHERLEVHVLLEPAGSTWLEGLFALEQFSLATNPKLFDVMDPRDPEASAVLTVELLSGR